MGMRVRSITAALAAALGSAGCTMASPPAEPRPAPAVIAVSGMGSVSVKPDTALAQLGAEARAATVADATGDVDRRMRAVLERLRALAIADRDVRTVVYAVDPVPTPPRPGEDPTRIASYRVTNVVEVRVRDLATVGRVVDAAVSAGANVLRALRFTLENREAAEGEARARAVRDATARARQLAEAAGVRLGEILLLTEGVSPRPVLPRGAVLTASSPGPIETGELEIGVTVEVHFRIARP
ncbi:MAG TPA: SIMPL domain-containing protein [Methylomirabilota bacterium]|nr:SIMPL domain-containing protein [Methylomirabilota bacterium]